MKCSLTDNRSWIFFILVVLLLFPLLWGCGQKQRGVAVSEEEQLRLEQRIHLFRDRSSSCRDGFDGEVSLQWRTTLSNTSFSGYFRTLLPSSLQLSALSPLNQPLFLISTDGTQFQSLDVSRRLYRSGGIDSLALKHDLPLSLLQGEWGLWLAGRLSDNQSASFTEIRWDKKNRGVWFSFQSGNSSTGSTELILLDIEELKMLERNIIDSHGTTVAVISYGDWQQLDKCAQPTTITISNLSFGSELLLILSDLVQADLHPEDFRLRVPNGYTRQLLP